MATIRQLNFSGGEISPSLYSRVDQTKYATGLRTCRNMFVRPHGGASNRSGTLFVGEVKDSSKTVKLIPFIFNSDQTYMLEFGDQYMRVIRNGAYVKETAKTITVATNASPIVLTSTSHGFSNGDEVVFAGAGMMEELLGRNFKVTSVTTHTFSLTYMDGTAVNSATFSTFVSGTAQRIYEIDTDYVEADLQDLQYVQSADVVTIVHPSYPPAQLTRSAHTTWTIADIDFEPSIAEPTITGFISLTESLSATENISNITQADPGVVTTSNAHIFQNGDRVSITGVVGMVEVNGGVYYVANRTNTTFNLATDETLSALYGMSGATAYVSGGTVSLFQDQTSDFWALTRYDPETGEESLPDFIDDSDHAPLSTAYPVEIGVSTSDYHNLYRQVNGVYGLVGSFTPLSVIRDVGSEPDFTITPPIERNPFDSSDNYPSTVTYAQQKLIFGNTENNPETVWTSRTGLFHNFTINRPSQDDNAITFSLAGRQVNAVKHIVELGKLVAFTSGGEWAINGNADGVITPTSINAKQHTYNGSGSRPPLLVNGNAIYLQARGSIIRDLGFDYQVDGYRGNDLTIFASHLFKGYTVSDWTYQQTPNSIIWAARSDGTLLGLTYVKEHQVFGWHRHDFAGGVVENVCSIPEGEEDSLYLVIKRTIDGRTTRYIEKMNTREITDIEDAIFMDSALTFDGRNAGSVTMTVSGSGWTYTDTLTLTASTASFSSDVDDSDFMHVGNYVFITDANGEEIRFEIVDYTSTTVVSVRPNRTVPAAMRSTALTTWAEATDTVGGLYHLEGETVSVFADGYVVASPNNPSYTQVTVTNGSITLSEAYSYIHVGLPFIPDMQTLDVDISEGGTLIDKKKLITKVTAKLEASRGFWVGSNEPDDDGIGELQELKIRNEEGYEDPVALVTGDVEVLIRPEWNSNGRIFIRQVDPLPLTVLAVAPAGLFGERG